MDTQARRDAQADAETDAQGCVCSTLPADMVCDFCYRLYGGRSDELVNHVEGAAADYSVFDQQMRMVYRQEQDEFDADCD